MTILNQRDPRWGGIKLGFSDTLIMDYGCTITCIAMIIGTTPDVVNDRMKAVNGFAQGNLVIWAKIEEAFPGIRINRVWSYNNDDVKANIPNVMVEVPAKPIGGTGNHWVVYIGSQKLNDPWTGTQRPTGDFPNPTGYCVITGAWQNQTSTKPTVNLDGDKFAELVSKATEKDRFDAAGYHTVDDLLKVMNEKEQIIQNQNKDLLTCQTNLKSAQHLADELNENDLSTSQQLIDAHKALKPLQDQISAIRDQLKISESENIVEAIKTLQKSKIKMMEKPKTFREKLAFLFS